VGGLLFFLGICLLAKGFFKKDRRYNLGFKFSGKMMLAGLVVVLIGLLLMGMGSE
jgi:hypothetical protein